MNQIKSNHNNWYWIEIFSIVISSNNITINTMIIIKIPLLRNIYISKILPSYPHNFSGCSTVKWYRDNINYHNNYSHDISWHEIFIAHPYCNVNQLCPPSWHCYVYYLHMQVCIHVYYMHAQSPHIHTFTLFKAPSPPYSPPYFARSSKDI